MSRPHALLAALLLPVVAAGCMAPTDARDLAADPATRLAMADDLALEVRFQYPHDPVFSSLEETVLWVVLLNHARQDLVIWGEYRDAPDAYTLTLASGETTLQGHDPAAPGDPPATPRDLPGAPRPFPFWSEEGTRFVLGELEWTRPLEGLPGGNWTVTARLRPFGVESEPQVFRVVPLAGPAAVDTLPSQEPEEPPSTQEPGP